DGAIVLPNKMWSPTGYALLHSIFPPLPRCTVPHRMIVAPTLLLILFCGYGCAKIRIKENHHKAMIILLSLLTMGIAKQAAPQKKDSNKSSFRIDRSLMDATERYPGGIVDVPLIVSEKQYVQQLYHGQKIIGGPGLDSVRPWSHRKYYQKNKLLLALERLAEKGKESSFRQKDLQQLYEDGFRLICIHLSLSKASIADYENLLKTQGMWDKRHQRLYIEIPKPMGD
ncbi:MAG: hypothetical protein VX278_15515, partial [Myxococcota bacterium]|nr:hypothetical protein [Myxococcota bacterium]